MYYESPATCCALAAPDSIKNENVCRDPKSLINLASKHSTVTPLSTMHALAIWERLERPDYAHGLAKRRSNEHT